MLELRNFPPETIAIKTLRFCPDGRFQYAYAPLPMEIRPFSQHFVLEVISEPVVGHMQDITREAA